MTHKKAGSIFNRLSSQQLQSSKGRKTNPLKGDCPKNDEPEMSLLKRCIANMDAKDKSSME